VRSLQPLPPSEITFNASANQPVLIITKDGRLEKAEGYSTEEAAQVMFDAVSGHIDGIWKKVRDENAALRAALDAQMQYQRHLSEDRDRLDWLEGEDGQSWTAKWYYWGDEWINRAAIDTARKEQREQKIKQMTDAASLDIGHSCLSGDKWMRDFIVTAIDAARKDHNK